MVRRSEEHTSEIQSRTNLVSRLPPEKKQFINEFHLPLPSTTIKTKEKIFALISIKKIIELIFVVSRIALFKTFKEKLFLIKLKTIAPIAPKEAASVGVAIPIKIDPKTKIIRIIGKKIMLKVFFKVYFFPLLILFIPVLLIFKQPDLGTALIIFFSGIIVLFLSGVQIKTFVLSGIGSLILLPIFWVFLEDYQKSRFINFLDQQSNTLGANYHITQSKIALGSGGFFGKGFLEGTQSHLNFIPEMETDFIFSVLGEEFGFLGILFLFFLYFILIYWGIKMSLESKNYFSKIFGVSFVASDRKSVV